MGQRTGRLGVLAAGLVLAAALTAVAAPQARAETVKTDSVAAGAPPAQVITYAVQRFDVAPVVALSFIAKDSGSAVALAIQSFASVRNLHITAAQATPDSVTPWRSERLRALADSMPMLSSSLARLSTRQRHVRTSAPASVPSVHPSGSLHAFTGRPAPRLLQV